MLCATLLLAATVARATAAHTRNRSAAIGARIFNVTDPEAEREFRSQVGSLSWARDGARDRNFHFDERSAFIDGKRVLVLSGALHYARLPVGDWERVLGLAQEMGLNTVQVYTMWNFHEPHRGEQCWSVRPTQRSTITVPAHLPTRCSPLRTAGRAVPT